MPRSYVGDVLSAGAGVQARGIPRNDRLVGWKRLTSASWFDGANGSSTLFSARKGERLNLLDLTLNLG
jgi:hypothetical protein